MKTANDTPTRALSDFLGRWRIARVIEDHLSGSTAQFEGLAEITRDGAGAVYSETGTLTIGGQSLRADRRYLWRQAGARIAVSFEDGRAFHSFDPVSGGAGTEHLCGADLYKVSYELAGFPGWSAQWAVSGPRKDYLMKSDYSPVS